MKMKITDKDLEGLTDMQKLFIKILLEMKGQIMTDKQIINKVREWLILNIRSMTMDDELIDDNKLLLKAIRDWKQERTNNEN